MSLTNVAVIGGAGRLGPHILQALTTASFNVIVISRQSSKSTYHAPIKTVHVPDSMPTSDIATALSTHHIDALVISMITDPETSIKFVDAAVQAGVKRVIPADFGSCDSSDPRSLEVVALYKDKKQVRDYLIDVTSTSRSTTTTASEGNLTWTSLITGHFLDYGLTSGLMSIDISSKKARIFDGGDKHLCATTLDGIANATVKILQNESVTRNKLLYVSSARFTQNELLATVEKVTGQSFTVEHLDSDKFIKEHKEKLARVGKDPELTEELVSVEGIVNGDWLERDGFANGLLGMPEEKLENIVRMALS